jgi:hypothetical protein
MDPPKINTGVVTNDSEMLAVSMPTQKAALAIHRPH